LLGGSQLDDLAEGFGLLAADGGQLAETVVGILFENPQRIATGRTELNERTQYDCLCLQASPTFADFGG
jgi:hypothetical protein